jgi:hypothetical protein
VAVLDSSNTRAYWRPQPDTSVWTNKRRELGADAGGFAAFLVEGDAREGRPMRGAGAYGLLSWNLAAAIRARPAAPVREIAHAVTEAVEAFHVEAIVVLSPDPGFAPFAGGTSRPSPVGAASIEITSPPPTRGVIPLESRRLKVTGRVMPREGVPVVVVQGQPATIGVDGSFEAQVELLPGRQKLSVVAILESRETVSTDVDVDVSPPSVVGVGKRWALVIGNEAYREADGWQALRTPGSDAEQIAKTLQEEYGFEHEIPGKAPQGQPFPLLLRDASRSEILRALDQLAREASTDDSVIIYYAGHGYLDAKINTSYWVPVGARSDDSSDWISASDLNEHVRRFDARHVLVVSDSCFSGAMVQRSAQPTPPPPETDQRLRFIQNAINRTSRTLLSSGASEPVADEGGSGHSVFARAFLQGLSEYHAKAFTADEVFTQLIQPFVGGNSQQMPQYRWLSESGNEGGDFVFVRVSSGEGGGPYPRYCAATSNATVPHKRTAGSWAFTVQCVSG